MATIKADTARNSYIEVDLPAGEALRLTLVGSGSGGTFRLRLQHDGLGGLQPGPEIPAESLGKVVDAAVQLLLSRP